MAERRELVRITHPRWEGNALILYSDWTWEATAEEEEAEQAMATFTTTGYRYSPADGIPGVFLAQQVAAMIPDAVVEIPPQPPVDPDAIY